MASDSIDLPEKAKLLHAHAILQTGQGSFFRENGNLIVRNDEEDGTLVFVAELKTPESLIEIIHDRPDRRVLCPSEVAGQVSKALPDWIQEESLILELMDESKLATSESNIRRLTKKDSLALVDPDLRKALEARIQSHSIFAAFDGQEAISFAFAHWRSVCFFDISIDTVESHRRQGWASKTVSHLICEELKEHRWPVWGAEVDNAASICLATQLGFVESGRLVLFSRS